MTQTIIAGIDPGAGGAVCFLDSRDWTMRVVDTPHEYVTVNNKRRKQVAAAALADLLRQEDLLAISTEKVHAMPQMDVKGIFTFGRFYGQIEMAAICLNVPHYIATDPAVWKRRMSVSSDKKLSRERCIQLVPAAAPLLTRVSDHDRGEAIMLALFGSFTLGLVPRNIKLVE